MGRSTRSSSTIKVGRRAQTLAEQFADIEFAAQEEVIESLVDSSLTASNGKVEFRGAVLETDNSAEQRLQKGTYLFTTTTKTTTTTTDTATDVMMGDNPLFAVAVFLDCNGLHTFSPAQPPEEEDLYDIAVVFGPCPRCVTPPARARRLCTFCEQYMQRLPDKTHVCPSTRDCWLSRAMVECGGLKAHGVWREVWYACKRGWKDQA